MSQLEHVKKEIEVRRLHRQEKLEIIEDYIGFVTAKTAGVVLIVAGVLEILSPEMINAVLPEPAGLTGIGFALLVGKKTAQFLGKMLEVFRK